MSELSRLLDRAFENKGNKNFYKSGPWSIAFGERTYEWRFEVYYNRIPVLSGNTFDKKVELCTSSDIYPYDKLIQAVNEVLPEYYFGGEVYDNYKRNLVTDPVLDENGMPAEETVWLCVYKDTLGFPNDFDNLTDILVPTDWFLKKVEAMGESAKGWFDECTADWHDGFARDAISDSVILDCSDDSIKNSLFKKAPSLDSMIRNAQERSTPQPVSDKAPILKHEH